MIYEWRDVKNFEGLYQVNEIGEVRSLSRPVKGKYGNTVWTKPKTLKPHYSPYASYTLCKGGFKYLRHGHRLVAEVFCAGECDGLIVRHLDGNPRNNHWSNLAWGTQQENNHDMDTHGTRIVLRGSECFNAILSEKEALEIFKSKSRGSDLATRYGVSQQTICDIRKGRRWGHITINS